jgi:hypothetical protein
VINSVLIFSKGAFVERHVFDSIDLARAFAHGCRATLSLCGGHDAFDVYQLPQEELAMRSCESVAALVDAEKAIHPL